MIHDGRAYIDNTIYKATFSCSLQLVLRHVLGWSSREDSIHLRAGTALHEAQAGWNIALLRGSDDDAARIYANELFAYHYREYADAWAEPESRFEYSNLSLVVDEWFTSRAGRLPWYVPDERLVEVGFAYPLDPQSGRDVAFGRMDIIGRDKNDHSWVVIDHKTTGRIDLNWTESWALDTQVTQYYWGGLQHVPNLSGFLVNGIEFSKLPASDRKCREHGLPHNQCRRFHMKAEIVGPIKRAPELLERWRHDALNGAAKYRYFAKEYDPLVVGITPDLSAVPMEGPFTGACRFCTFKDFCRTGQNANALPVMFVQDEWMPFDPREVEGKESPAAEVLNG